jgi:hypothetical protein
MSEETQVVIEALMAYARQLGYYAAEADRFGGVVDEADVTNEAWGVVGRWAKTSYADRLGELRSLLVDMREGVESLTEKLNQTAAVYQGAEEDQVIRFGEHEAMIDGPKP